MPKSRASYHANIDYETNISRLRDYRSNEIGYSFEVTGGRGRAEAQIALGFQAWNVSVNIYPTGLIQIYYITLENLRNAVNFIEKNCASIGNSLILVALDPEDPIDKAVELKTIAHFQNTDLKYATAKLLFFWYKNPKNDVFIIRIPDRDNKLEVPGNPFVFDACVPVTIHVIDKYDKQGNKIITAELLRRKAIEEARRCVRAHSKVRFSDNRVFDVT